jgi:hypothetical protein
MRGFIIDCRIRFHFDHDSRAFAPNQVSADKFACTGKRIASEKSASNDFFHYSSAAIADFNIRSHM